LDKSALESYRKKIIDELGRKEDVTSDKKQPNASRNNSDPHRNSRFSTPQNHRDGFRRNNHSNEQIRRNNFTNNGRVGNNRVMQQQQIPERSRFNFNRFREK
jgi:hypothetical protein